jgi:Reverse transcriptase (RNA-dependent DNA polymerase)
VTRSKRDGVDRNLQWAQKTLRDIKRAVRRIANIYDFQLDANDDVFKVRRSDASRKKKKKQRPKEVLKYGVVVPRNVKEAFELDSMNGNAFWRNAIKTEIDSLISMECFEFHEKGHKPGNDYQWTTLTMIFDVKQDLRRKARLVAGGHLVDSLDNNVYSSTVKGISVRILYVIAHKRNLKLLCGDVGNAYVNAYTNEKVYSHCGMEFGPDYFGKTITIKKALYGLRTSSERWWSHFADTLRGLNFRSARYDKDVWIRLSKDGMHYEYVCTHSDDFMIAARKPQAIMDAIKETYNVKSEGPPDYYLGNDYKQDKKGRWCFGCKRYIKEALVRVEQMFGTLTKSTVPILHGDHPELDESELLDDSGHRKYQMLIGILNWIVTIGRFDVTFATMSLSRFTSCPRKGHLDRALKIFGYLKRKPNRRICVDSSDPKYSGFESEFSKDYTQILADEYPDSSEEIDSRVPKPLIDEMKITAFVDSDHAHDKVTRRSVTGLIILVGRTPIFFSSKRQGAIETSTYGAEFCAMRTAVEELMSVRYMLRCLGVKVEHASYLFGDNLGVVQNATIKESLLKKKHVAISYHKVREAAASGIVHPTKIDGKFNFADVCTKAQTNAIFHTLCGGLMYG